MPKYNYDNDPKYLNTFDLRRGAGESHEYIADLNLPERIDNGLEGAVKDTPVHFELTLFSAMDGIYLKGSATLEKRSECARCTKLTKTPVNLGLQAFYIYDDKRLDESALGEDLDTSDEMYNLIEHRYIDLEQLVRDSFYETLKFNPICSENCQGIQGIEGVTLSNQGTLDKDTDVPIDPRFAALAKFSNPNSRQKCNTS